MNGRSKRLAGKFLIVDVQQNNSGEVRLGITATRHYGNACQRNRFKRLVRESFRLIRSHLILSANLNVRPRAYAKNAKQQDIQVELMELLSLQP